MVAFKAGGGVVEIIECDGEEETIIGATDTMTAERGMRERRRGAVRVGYQ